MAWKILVGDKSMLLDDLSQDDLVDACKGHDISWYRLWLVPGEDPGAFYDLVCKVAQRLELPSPDRPKNVGEMVKFLSHCENVDDDLPKEFEEGGIPKAEADVKETTLPSTSTAPENGAQSKRVAHR